MNKKLKLIIGLVPALLVSTLQIPVHASENAATVDGPTAVQQAREFFSKLSPQERISFECEEFAFDALAGLMVKVTAAAYILYKAAHVCADVFIGKYTRRTTPTTPSGTSSFTPKIYPEKSSETAESPEAPKADFSTLAGTIPQDVIDVVEYIKDPSALEKFGISMPKGILLVGPPGNGKTAIARAIAGEVQASFFSISASKFVLPLVGLGAAAIRDLFDKAKESVKSGKYKKSIIFIDEIDAIGVARQNGRSDRGPLTELLTQMDGFEQNPDIIVIAATNTVTDLDSALTRPGRFDRVIQIDNPNYENRLAVIKFYLKNKPTNVTDAELDLLAQRADGLSAAEIKNFVNEAAVRAMRAKADCITYDHCVAALDVIIQTKSLTGGAHAAMPSIQELIEKLSKIWGLS